MKCEIESPLNWPVGWPRTASINRRHSRFNDDGRVLSLTLGEDRVYDEFRKMGAVNVLITYHGRGTDHRRYDTGAAVYFVFENRSTVLACDRWYRVADNLAAIAAHVEALRGIDRWGVGTLAQAFAGYRALPAAGAIKPWWEVLGMNWRPESFDLVKARYLALMKRHHPDHGGNANQAAEISAAYDQARKEFGQ